MRLVSNISNPINIPNRITFFDLRSMGILAFMIIEKGAGADDSAFVSWQLLSNAMIKSEAMRK